MTRKFIKVLVPPAVAPPRGAVWAADVAIALARIEAAATRTAERANTHPSLVAPRSVHDSAPSAARETVSSQGSGYATRHTATFPSYDSCARQ